MKYMFYSVFDKGIMAYTRPFMMQADGQALRSFIDEASKPDSEIGKHPEDYSLFRIGTFDETAGEVSGHEPVCIGRAHELVRKEK